MTDDDLIKKATDARSESQEPLASPRLSQVLEPMESPESQEPAAEAAEVAPAAPAVEWPNIAGPDAGPDAEPDAGPDAGIVGAAPPALTAPRRSRISPRSPRQAIEPEVAPPPPGRSRQARHPLVVVLNFFMMVGVLAALVMGAGLYFGAIQFNAEGPLTEPKTILISRGADLQSIAGLLARQNIIDSSRVFSTGIWLSKTAGKLKAGEYLFEARASMRDVMNVLISGKAILHAFTVPEGLTSEQIVIRLLDAPILSGEVDVIPDEGTLLPETYKYSRGTTRKQIIDQMRRAQERTVAELWARRASDLPITTLAEFVTLASIVEKETGKADERPLVAAVFINRLRRNIKLQSDPTILYGLFGGKGKPPDRPIYRSDINSKTPFNTYVIEGLPPGPISNPGRAALEAVANPSRTADLFFVADGTGGHAFSATLEEHNRNVVRWRRVAAEKRKAEEAAQRAAEAAAGEAAQEAAQEADRVAADTATQNGAGTGNAGDTGSKTANGVKSEATGIPVVKPKPKPQ